MKPVYAHLLGLAGIMLLVSGCTTGGNRQSVVSGRASVSTPCSSCDDSRCCRPPMWYWSRGRYLPFIDDYLTKKAARKCAVHSLRKFEGKKQAGSIDYQQGYIQAYEDLAMGSRGVVPAVAPARYWKTHNRSVKGHLKAEQWFAGYRAALSQAGYRIAQEQVTIPTSFEQLHPVSVRGEFNRIDSCPACSE